jgi:8-oxo-dGTP pyrophosphatase MutT (NUDIX family)
MITKEQIVIALKNHRRTERSLAELPEFTRAAVLILLFPARGELHVLFTVRTYEVETHKGQISFPGGMQDTTDTDVIHTALREAREELGLQTDSIEVLGLLDDVPVISKFLVTPVVAYMSEPPTCVPNSAEVSEVFSVPLSFFADERNARSEQREREGKTLTVWFYQYEKHTIWGATAAMMRAFMRIVMETR